MSQQMASTAPSTDKEKSRDSKRLLTRLRRHFSTIGIGDVFIHPPTHPFPKDYLDAEDQNTDYHSKSFSDISSPPGGFTSWEIVGTIKSIPEDFCVREIFPLKQNVIPGISEFDQQSLRIAKLHDDEGSSTIQQNLPGRQDTKHSTKDGDIGKNSIEMTQKEKGVPEAISSTNGGRSDNDPPRTSPSNHESNADIIQHFLHRIFTSRENEKDGVDIRIPEVLSSLEGLQNDASKRIGELSRLKDTNASGDAQICSPKDVWIPPIVDSSTNDSSDRSERGALHRALKIEYPLLKSEGAKKQLDGMSSQNHWIRVTYDDTFEDLVPFLHDPSQDLIALYRFRNLGFQGVDGSNISNIKKHPKAKADFKKHYRDGRHSDGDDTRVVLRLRPGMSKDDRRSVHHLISQKCRHFETSTIPEVALDSGNGEKAPSSQGATTAAVGVRWSKNALKSSKKRKRNNQDDNADCPMGDNAYPHILCVLKKRQKEHLVAINDLSAALRCRQSDIGLAGIKDMHAITYQYCTLRFTRPGRIFNAKRVLKEKGIELGTLLKVDWLLNKGDLEGNCFEIVVRDLQRVRVKSISSENNVRSTEEALVACEQSHIHDMVERIRKSGFINFFGEQRVGQPGSSEEIGVRAFDIGRAMLQNDFSLAVDLLLRGRSMSATEGRSVDDKELSVRNTWKESNGDVVATMKALPNGNFMPKERAVLKGLNRYGKDKPLEAFRCLQYNMRVFYVNAYQSYIWNMAATERIKLYGMKVVIGDLYIPKSDRGEEQPEVRVVDASSETSVKPSQVVLPLPGHSVSYPENEIGAVYTRLLAHDSVQFDKDAPPEGTAKGSYRHLFSTPRNLRVAFDEDNSETAKSMKLSFEIPKGCYATMLLRELMLTTVSRACDSVYGTPP